MKRYKRVEIIAFRRRVAIRSGEAPTSVIPDERLTLNDLDSSETIDTGSAEGRAILIEAVRLLEDSIAQSNCGGITLE